MLGHCSFPSSGRNIPKGMGKGVPVNPPMEVMVIIIEDSEGVKVVIGPPWLSKPPVSLACALFNLPEQNRD